LGRRLTVLGFAAALLLAWSFRGGGAATLPAERQRTDWSTFGFDTARDGNGPDGSITPVSAGRLRLLWRTPLGAATITSPVFAGLVPRGGRRLPVVYVGTEQGGLFAVDAADGGVLWRRRLGSVQTTCYDMPGDVFGISGTPVIDRSSGRIYVAASNGTTSQVAVHALDLSTGAEAPGWPVVVSTDPAHNHVWGALTLSGGTLFAVTASLCDQIPSYGRVVKIDVATAAVRATWGVVRHDGAVVGGGGIWGYGGASIDPGSSDLFVATGNAFAPEPESLPYAERVVRLSAPGLRYVDSHHPRLEGIDVDFSGTPVLYQAPGCPPELAVENKSGTLLVYERGALSRGPIQTLQVAANSSIQGLGIFIGMPAYSNRTRMLYVADPGPDAPGYPHGMLAFRVDGGCRLQLAWHASVGPDGTTPVSPPTVAGDVVYYGTGRGGTVVALDARTGRVLWDSATAIGGAVFAPPIALAGRVFVAAWDDHDGGALYAFGP
jgi:outer membrane protein assembly factor BamB